jgi:hypothetical protein
MTGRRPPPAPTSTLTALFRRLRREAAAVRMDPALPDRVFERIGRAGCVARRRARVAALVLLALAAALWGRWAAPTTPAARQASLGPAGAGRPP